MPASYPAAIKTFTTKNNGDLVDSSHVDDLQAEVAAIETTLGINPNTATPTASKIPIADAAAHLDGWLSAKLTGWVMANETWAYASATTITVPTGAAARYAVGDKLMWTANAVVLYAYVVGVADTVLTVAGNPVTNFTITLNYYSHESNPVLFPHWFAYTPTGGPTTNNTQGGRFKIEGRTVTAIGRITFTGAPAAWTGNPSLPVAASANQIGVTPLGIAGFASYRDSGTATVLNTSAPEVLANGTTVLLFKADGTAFSTTVPITWANGDFVDYTLFYEI